MDYHPVEHAKDIGCGFAVGINFDRSKVLIELCDPRHYASARLALTKKETVELINTLLDHLIQVK